MNLKEAEEIARLKFKEYFSNRPIPDEIFERLSRGIRRENDEVSIEIMLQPDIQSPGGLENDMCYPKPQLMVEIKVNRISGNVIIRELPEITW